MKLKRILTLTAAAALTTALLTGCPWEQDDAASSEPSSSSSSSSRPSHDSDSGDDDTETPDEPEEPSKPDEPDEPDEPAGGDEEPEKDPDAPKVELSEDGTTLTITGGSGELTEAAFEGVDKTEIIELDLSGSGYTSIGYLVFGGCTDLKSIELPKGLETIGTAAFQSCLDLTSVTLPEGLETIGTGAFQFCRSLERIDLPSTLTAIEDSAFSGCYELTSIKLPNTLTKIGIGAFMSCTKLTNIYVGDGILKAEIGGNAFDGVGGLEEEPITVTVYYPSEWGEESDDNSNLNNLKSKLNFGIGVTVDYVPYDELTQTTSELSDGVKGLMEAARLFGL